MKKMTILSLGVLIVFLLTCCTNRYANYMSPASDPLMPGSESGGVGKILTTTVSDKQNDFAMIKTKSQKKENQYSVKDSNTFDRIMIYNAFLALSVKTEIDTAISEIKQAAQKLNGYILSFGNDEITIRIPSESLNEAIAYITGLGEITKKNVVGNDFTDWYYDLKIRLDNMEKTRQRYLSLLEQCDNVETILKIEKELERITYEIESLKGQIQRINHLKEFSSITVNLSKKVSPGPVSWIFYGIYKGIALLFVW